MGYFLTLALVAFLLVMWLASSPFLRWAIYWGDLYRRRTASLFSHESGRLTN
jgi:hypothetical protein